MWVYMHWYVNVEGWCRGQQFSSATLNFLRQSLPLNLNLQNWQCWPVSPRDPPVSTFLVLRLQANAVRPGFHTWVLKYQTQVPKFTQQSIHYLLSHFTNPTYNLFLCADSHEERSYFSLVLVHTSCPNLSHFHFRRTFLCQNSYSSFCFLISHDFAASGIFLSRLLPPWNNPTSPVSNNDNVCVMMSTFWFDTTYVETYGGVHPMK